MLKRMRWHKQLVLTSIAIASFMNYSNDKIVDIKKGNPMINIGLQDDARKQIAQILNALLADEFVLYTKTLKFHWNVVGRNFGPLHALFKEQYESLFDIVDDVAERARSVGYAAFGTLDEFKKNSTLPENPGFNPDDMGMIANLLADHEVIIRSLRLSIETTSELGDEGTSNFLTDLMEKHEKKAWMLRAHLEK